MTVRVILETDIGNDIDDALALAMLHHLMDVGECELLAVTINKDNLFAAIFTNIVNTFYDHPDIPIGLVRNGVEPDDYRYIRQISTAEENGKLLYPRSSRAHSGYPDAVSVLRQTLANQPDGSVLIVSIGFLTNLARLLDSGPDEFSSLPGHSLVTQKVKELSCMAGNFSPLALKTGIQEEYNIAKDVSSATHVVQNWPVPIVFSGFEVGSQIVFPASAAEKTLRLNKLHCVYDAYARYRSMPYNCATWDLTSVLHAVRPHRYFEISPRGRVGIKEPGVASFTETPDGQHSYLKLNEESIQDIVDTMVSLVR